MENTNLQDKYFNWALNTQLRPFDDDYFLYHFIFSKYVEDEVFSLQKYDKNLEKYLKENELSFNNIEKIIGKLLTINSDEQGIKDNILVILDYIRWSYNINVKYDNPDYS